MLFYKGRYLGHIAYFAADGWVYFVTCWVGSGYRRTDRFTWDQHDYIVCPD